MTGGRRRRAPKRQPTQAAGEPAIPGGYVPPSIHQCAWCLRVQGPDGGYGGEPQPALRAGATHGICDDCRARWLAAAARLDATRMDQAG